MTTSPSVRARPRRVGDAPVVRRSIIGIVLLISAIVLVAPIVIIFTKAFSSGIAAIGDSLMEPSTFHAIKLTVLTALVVVPINTMFGIAAAWAVTKFRFRGRAFLIVLIEIPFSVSPIVAGVAYLFVYGTQGLFGPALDYLDIKIMFTVPAIMLASLFVTAPFVARELIPLMQVQGTEQEEAAHSLGASGLATFMRVTLPNVKWALLYGVMLCNARVMGEFGAVSVVSGKIRGVTSTLPLQIELLYQDYNIAGSFAAAIVLAAIALATIAVKAVVEHYSPQPSSR